MDEHSENVDGEKTWRIEQVTKLKNTISEQKNALQVFNSSLGEVDVWISKLEKKDLWSNIKYNNIGVIRVPEERRERGRKFIWRTNSERLP